MSSRRLLPLAAVALLPVACAQPLKLARDDSPTVLAHHAMRAPDPSARGPYAVRTLVYGSGTDRRRRAYRDSVTLKTRPVDGSKLATAPDPKQGKVRRRYWGFGFDSLPVNGRVWYPEGPGPFPLVLVVHGNHDMKEPSDPGYAYLGELLASRGYILASVDENFLNGWMRGENDARGWLLLEHLRAWRGFNDSSGTPFTGKVDLRNVALIGHSRGGEAVAVAAAFNRLRHYPDDATVDFDYGFGIRSIVAIAPIDGQYKPTEQPTPVADVNYFVMHGSHDGDVSAFSGLRQYERVRFTEGGDWFKSAVWVYRANHGQWNTVWGARDAGKQSARVLDLRGLLAPEAQRKFAEVYVSAFLDATLKGKREYLPMFRDHRAAADWLPKTMYLTRFQDAGFRALASYGEDVDVTTGTAPGVRIAGDSLSTWKEATVPLRWKDANMGHQAVWLGWSNVAPGGDTVKHVRPASYTLALTDSLRAAWRVGAGSALELSLAPTDATPGARKAPKDTTKKAAAPAPAPAKAKAKAKAKGGPRKPAAAKDTTPVDLTIEVADAAGVTARLPLSRYGAIRRPLPVAIYRRAGRDKQRFASTNELVLQTYVLPLADFARAEPRFDPARLTSVRLVFDRARAGTIVLSDVGLSALDPAYLAASSSTP